MLTATCQNPRLKSTSYDFTQTISTARGFRFSVYFYSSFAPLSQDTSDFNGLVVGEEEGESYLMRSGTSIVKIKISKTQGAESFSFLFESFRPGDAIPVHKHSNEDEYIFLHKGSGLFTLGDKQYQIKEGTVTIVPKGVWHGFQNNGSENIEMRFGYTPSGFEGFCRKGGTPVGQPFIQKTMDERRAIAKKWGMTYRD